MPLAPARPRPPAPGTRVASAAPSAASAPAASMPAPAATPAPDVPIAITPPGPVIEPVQLADDGVDEDASADEDEQEDEEEDEGESEEDKAERLASETPVPRQRRPVAIIEAIDKITAESMRFEVEVGGRPVRFNQSLIFTARACEVSAENELVEDAIAYLDVTLQPRAAGAEPRQIFRGWMFASSPALSGLQHPIYDAWVVGCKA